MKSLLYAIARLLGKAKWVAVVAFVLVIVALLLAIVIWVPQWQVAGLRGAVEPQELFAAENSARVTLVQIVGGIALMIGLYGGWRNFLSLQKNVNIAEQRQIAERFTRAIDQLGNKDSLEVRLGGIYALGQIAKDSPRDYHQTVVEVLAAYVRQNAPWEASGEEENGEGNQCPTDIQAILTIVGRLGPHPTAELFFQIDLQRTLLRKANLGGANLERANLEVAILDGANLGEANLGGANLRGANLGGANLKGANLKGANLERADLRRANLAVANLRGAILWETNLRRASLEGVDLRATRGLTREQIETARVDENTQLPDYIKQANGTDVPE